jgi:hypothetical protein
MKNFNSEKRIQNAILVWLKYHHFLAWHIPNRGFYNARINRYNIPGAHFVPGIPDIEVVLPKGVTVRIEVKSATGKLSENQEDMFNKLASLGHYTLLARSVEDVERYFRANAWTRGY